MSTQINLQVQLSGATTAYLQLVYPYFTYTTNISLATFLTYDTGTGHLYSPDGTATSGLSAVSTLWNQPISPVQLPTEDSDGLFTLLTCSESGPDLMCVNAESDRGPDHTPNAFLFCAAYQNALYTYNPDFYDLTTDCGSESPIITEFATVAYKD